MEQIADVGPIAVGSVRVESSCLPSTGRGLTAALPSTGRGRAGAAGPAGSEREAEIRNPGDGVVNPNVVRDSVSNGGRRPAMGSEVDPEAGEGDSVEDFGVGFPIKEPAEGT